MSEENQDLSALRQSWPMPSHPRPITIIGAGGIIRESHLPAYRKHGLPVEGIYDLNPEAAAAIARDFGGLRVHKTLEDAIAACGADGVFDLALPPAALLENVRRLPRNATVLMQKPLGPDGAAARQIVAAARELNLTAATNFQLRFTPSMLVVQDAVERGLFGEVVDVDIHVTAYMPWELWSFIPKMPAVELPLHSIHYLDWIRGLLGEPASIYAKAVKHPRYPDLADARSSIILDYGDRARVALSLNHTYDKGPAHIDATIRVEGTRGAAHVTVGYLIDYVNPLPERLEIKLQGQDWREVPLSGGRMPDSFAYVMANLQRFAAGEDARLITEVGDSMRTMFLVDAGLTSSRQGGVRPET